MSVERARHDLTLLRTALTASSLDMYRDMSAYNPDGGLRAPGFNSTVLWEKAGEIQRGYMSATAGIARAHRAMLGDDQIPGGGWVRGLAWLELHPERRVPLASATVLNGVDLLDALLEQYPQSRGVKEACGHITAAVRSVVQSYLPAGAQPSRPRRRCVHCGRKPAEDDRKWCSRCRRGHQRGACVVCRTTAA